MPITNNIVLIFNQYLTHSIAVITVDTDLLTNSFKESIFANLKLESNFSTNKTRQCSANSGTAHRQEHRASARSCLVTGAGSSGAGWKSIG